MAFRKVDRLTLLFQVVHNSTLLFKDLLLDLMSIMGFILHKIWVFCFVWGLLSILLRSRCLSYMKCLRVGLGRVGEILLMINGGDRYYSPQFADFHRVEW